MYVTGSMLTPSLQALEKRQLDNAREYSNLAILHQKSCNDYLRLAVRIVRAIVLFSNGAAMLLKRVYFLCNSQEAVATKLEMAIKTQKVTTSMGQVWLKPSHTATELLMYVSVTTDNRICRLPKQCRK